MNIGFSRIALSVGAAALLAGCGGSQLPSATPNTLQRSSRTGESVGARSLGPAYKTTSPLLYVATFAENLEPLRIYKANAKDPGPLATIREDIYNSSGACIDGDGTLYVTNQASPGYVSEYALGHTKPVRVITKGINTPAYCAIDASGNLWVTNIGLDDVAEYLKGSTKPYSTITNGLTYPVGIAIDRAGNLYVGNLQPHSAPNIQVYASGSATPSRTITDGITWPVGIAVDAHDTLYVANFTAPGNVEEYRSGESTPYRTITEDLVYPADIVLNKRGWLYVAVWGYTSGQSVILEFPPRSLKPSSRKITKGVYTPQGLAYYPPVLP